MPAASKSIEIDVPPDAVMAVITDFAHYPEFLPEMERATVIRRDGDTWVVAFAIRVIRRLEYTLELTRTSPTALRWRLVEGAFKANDGAWDLRPLDGGRRTHATYTIDLDFGMFVPGSVVNTVVGTSLPATLAAFKKRAESR